MLMQRKQPINWKTYYFYILQEEGMDRLTFQLEQDASGEVDVHVHKTQVNIFQIIWWTMHYGE